MTYLEMLKLVERELTGIDIPEGRARVSPLVATRDYRGKKRQRVVGYSWSHAGSHFMTGRVYDCILGHGDTFEAALAMMRKRMAP